MWSSSRTSAPLDGRTSDAGRFCGWETLWLGSCPIQIKHLWCFLGSTERSRGGKIAAPCCKTIREQWILSPHLVLFLSSFEMGGLFSLSNCTMRIIRGELVLFVVMKRPAWGSMLLKVYHYHCSHRALRNIPTPKTSVGWAAPFLNKISGFLPASVQWLPLLDCFLEFSHHDPLLVTQAMYLSANTPFLFQVLQFGLQNPVNVPILPQCLPVALPSTL